MTAHGPAQTTAPTARAAAKAATRAATVYRLAAGFTLATIALGSVVCATDSSSACPAWPVCYADRIGPQVQGGWLENPVIEFVHRLISFTCLVLLAYSGWLGRRSRDTRLRLFPWIALGLAIGSAVFGMMIILFTLPLGLALLDVGGAVVALGLITVAAQTARRVASDAPGGPSAPDGPSASGDSGTSAPSTSSAVSVVSGSTFGLLVAMHLLGIVVAGRTSGGDSSFTRCLSWPLWQTVEMDGYPALQGLRIGMAALALVLIVSVIARSLRVPHLRPPAVGLSLALVGELALGLVIASQGLEVGQTTGIHVPLAVAYSLLAVAVLWAVASLAGRALPPPADLDATDRQRPLITSR